MDLKKPFFRAMILTLFIGFINCNNNDDNDNKAQVKFNLVDAPGDYLEVNVEINDITYNTGDDDEGWKSFESFDKGMKIDLTELVAGNSVVLVDEPLPEGRLNQIRLVLGDNNTIVIEDDNGNPGTPLDLETPSAQQSGLKLKVNEEIEGGFTYSFILDWDVNKSIVETGNDKYILKPTINVILVANSGIVSGKIVDESGAGLKVLNTIFLSNGTENLSTSSNDLGEFMFQGVMPGTYNLKVELEGYTDYDGVAGILVEEGVERKVGDVVMVGS